MSAEIEPLLNQLKKGLATLYRTRLKHVILYGSYARDEQTAGSDLDVLVVLSDFERGPLEIEYTSRLVAELSLQYLVTISPVFVRERDWLKADRPLLRNIRAEGLAL